MTLSGAPRLRLMLGAFGDPGHAFPMLALGAELAARGHEVTLQTWGKWADHVRAAGMRFAPAPEYHVFPTRERPLKPYAAVVKAAREIEPAVRAARPHAVVADILTLAPALAAERAGVPVGPSTAQDSEQRLLRAAVEGLADLPVRVLGTWNRRPPPRPLAAPANARLVEWVSYSRTMPRCDVVICHGGHGTVMRALSS